MSAHQFTILKINAGREAPDDLLTHLLEKHRSGLGTASVNKGQLMCSANSDTMALKDLKEMLNAGDDYTAPTIIAFCNFPEGAVEDDYQPYVFLADNDSNPILVGFFEGDFDEDFRDEKSVASTQRNVAERYLQEKLKDMYDSAGGDLTKLFDKLNTPIAAKEISNMISGENGYSFILLGANGTTAEMLRGDAQATSYDWGWVSNTHGWAPSVAATPPKVGSLKDRFGKLKATTASVPASPEPQKVTLPAAAPPTPPPDKKDGEQVHHDGADATPDTSAWPQGIYYDPAKKKIFAQCPSTIMGKERRRAWYLKHTGSQPAGLKNNNHPPVVEIPKSVAEFTRYAENLGGSPAKNISTQHIPSPPESTKPVAEKLPIVEAEQVERFKKWLNSDPIKEIIAKKAVADPKTFQAMEEKYPSFTDRTGEELEKTYQYPFELRVMIAQEFPELVALAWMNVSAELVRTLGELEEATAPPTEAPKQTATNAVPSPKPPAGSLKARFGGGQAAKAVAVR